MSALFLDDEQPPAKRGRPRWVDGLGLVLVVGGMIAVGVLGDRGSKDERSAPTTTTSTSPSTTTTTTPSPTPPSSTPTIPLRFAPLPSTTRTRLLVLDPRTSVPMVFDVDAGIAQVAANPLDPGIGTTAGVLGVRNGELTVATYSADATQLRTTTRPLGNREWVLTPVGQDGAWVTAQEGVDVVTGLVGPDGKDTGKLLRLRPGAFLVAGFPDGVVTAQAGALTWVPVHGSPRALGTGAVFGYGGGRVVRNSCHLLRCRLEVVDVHTGVARAVTGVPELQPEVRSVAGTAVGADGAWVATGGFDAVDGYALLFAVDLASGRGTVLKRGAGGSVVAAVAGPWVFALDDVRHALVAYHRETGEEHVLLAATGLQGAGLVAVPSP